MILVLTERFSARIKNHGDMDLSLGSPSLVPHDDDHHHDHEHDLDHGRDDDDEFEVVKQSEKISLLELKVDIWDMHDK